MAISNNRLTKEQYIQNFSDIHPPFDHPEGAIIEANRCLNCYDAPCTKSIKNYAICMKIVNKIPKNI